MKVYINHRTGVYSGGLIVVAANSPEEAHGTMFKDLHCEYDSMQYKFENWEELQGVSYDGDKPKVLAEGGYTK